MSLTKRENELIDKMLSGDRIALARLITLVESRYNSVPEILKRINPKTGKAYIIGITGPPGAGKSTLVNEQIQSYKKDGKKVGVIAVDPSSPFTGGAVLGDRIRMQDHALDENVFIRSLGSRGSHGGLSRATKEIIKLYDAFGIEIIIIETVGVGQTELDIIKLADTVIVVLVPESGDVVQTLKAGLMEIADIFIVNKADREGADTLSKEIQGMVSLSPRDSQWDIPVLLTSAYEKRGIKGMLKEINRHRSFQIKTNLLNKKREKRIEEEFSQIILEVLEHKIHEKLDDLEVGRVLNMVKEGKLDPYEAAEQVLSRIL
ncbi:methylmalonyl Co-A mutase-associated GTPase MeaB [Desulfobacterota bacterium AH_259_B03_O07]|nr:methylmalonyl Co-A mutase-associated GTPase MeaB [Desulfobacterota bacterium AH_259_B03_O07]